jgi:hypothetical protein
MNRKANVGFVQKMKQLLRVGGKPRIVSGTIVPKRYTARVLR